MKRLADVVWRTALSGRPMESVMDVEMLELGHRAWYYREMEERYPGRWIIYMNNIEPALGSDVSSQKRKRSGSQKRTTA